MAENAKLLVDKTQLSVYNGVVSEEQAGRTTDDHQRNRQYRVIWLTGPYAPGNAKDGKYQQVWLTETDVVA